MRKPKRFLMFSGGKKETGRVRWVKNFLSNFSNLTDTRTIFYRFQYSLIARIRQNNKIIDNNSQK